MDLRDVVRKETPAPPCDHYMNVSVKEASEGKSRGIWTVTDEMINGNGVAMGGFSGAAADIMFAYAISSQLEMDEVFASINLNTTFLKPVIRGEVEILCWIHKKGRTAAYGSATLMQNGKTVAEATSSIMIIKK